MGSDPNGARAVAPTAPPPASRESDIPATTDGEAPRAAAGCSVLVVDPDPAMRSFLQRGLARHFALVESVGARSEAEALLGRCNFDLLILDLPPGDAPGEAGALHWAESLRDQAEGPDLIFLAADADNNIALAAMRRGAVDCIPKPFQLE